MTAQVSSSAEPSKAMLWTGRILSLIPTLMLLFSASMKLMHGPQVVEGFAKFGYAEKVITPLGVVEVLDVQRDRGAGGVAGEHAGADARVVALELHPPAAAKAVLAPGELGIEQRRRQREPRGHPLENAGQRRTMRLTGGQKA